MNIQEYQSEAYLEKVDFGNLMEEADPIKPEVVGSNPAGKWLKRLGMLMWVVALVMVLVTRAPEVVYRISPGLVDSLAVALGRTVMVDRSEFGTIVHEEAENRYQPAFDATLPEENRLIVESLGIDTEIGEGDYEVALKSGVWRAGDLGTPFSRGVPTVMAAHRFGYLNWSNQYRRENSFFNLPKLETGDKVEIVWNQRLYEYEIVEGYTDTKIRDYNSDLVLYTCEVLNSLRRIIRLARLVENEESVGENGFGVLLSQG